MNLNESELEKRLRNPPQPKPAAALKQRLTAEIKLPAKTAGSAVVITNGGFAGWLRRWWPALAPASVSLACVAVLVAQVIEARELRASNLALAKEVAEAERSMENKAATEKQNSSSAVEAAAVEQKEIVRLRERVTQLGGEIARLETMQAENVGLRRQAATAAGLTEEELAAVEKARARAQSIACINNLKQVGLAIRIWANDNKDFSPPDFLSLSNELNTPKILVCPDDTNRIAATNFANYSDANCSYEYLTPNAANAHDEPQRVLTRCPIHGHIGLCDGSVRGELAKKDAARLVLRDGKLYLRPDVDSPVRQLSPKK